MEQILTSDPGDEIAVLGRRQLERPMVLATGRGETTCKLCKRRYNGSIASPAKEETIYQTGGATVHQSDVEDCEKAFPCHLCPVSQTRQKGGARATAAALTMIVHEKPIIAHRPNLL